MQHTFGQQISVTCVSFYLGDSPEGIAGNDRCLLKLLTVATKQSLAEGDTATCLKWIIALKLPKRPIFLLRKKNYLSIARWKKTDTLLVEMKNMAGGLSPFSLTA